MRKKTCIVPCLLFLLFLYSLPSYAVDLSKLSETLLRLDSLISVKSSIHARQEAKLDSLKRLVAQTDDVWQRYMLYGSLFYEYLHYQADSSFTMWVRRRNWCLCCITLICQMKFC